MIKNAFEQVVKTIEAKAFDLCCPRSALEEPLDASLTRVGTSFQYAAMGLESGILGVHDKINTEALRKIDNALDDLPQGVRFILHATNMGVYVGHNMAVLADTLFKDANKRNAFLERRRRAIGLYFPSDKNPIIFAATHLQHDELTGIKETLYHEIGHHMDALSGRFSHTALFHQYYKSDCAAFARTASPRLRNFYAYYLPACYGGKHEDIAVAAQETFAELVAHNLGAKAKYPLAHYMPLTVRQISYVVRRLDQQGLKQKRSSIERSLARG